MKIYNFQKTVRMASTQAPEINLGKNLKVLKKIGEGAFGVIYHAVNLKT